MMDFISFARAHGVEIDPSRLYAGDRIRRCGTTDKPNGTNGAYFWDGARGWVFNWSGDAKVQWWNDPKASAWTEAEKAAWRAKRMAADRQKQGDQAQAARRAAEMLRTAKPDGHSYLHIKGFPEAQGFVAADGALLIPMRSFGSNELQGVQVIRWNEEQRKYEKKMTPGMKAKGAVFRMGEKFASEVFLCEGYATGLSIAAALRSVGLRAGVLVCFSAANLVHIAPMVKSRAFVFADNDESGTGEKAAEDTGLPYCMADTVGWDANDLHINRGLMAVSQKLMEARLPRMLMAA